MHTYFLPLHFKEVDEAKKSWTKEIAELKVF
jgi:hypothetical protein